MYRQRQSAVHSKDALIKLGIPMFPPLPPYTVSMYHSTVPSPQWVLQHCHTLLPLSYYWPHHFPLSLLHMPFVRLAPHAAVRSSWKLRPRSGDQGVAEERVEETQKEVGVVESTWKKLGEGVTWHASHHHHHQGMSGSLMSWRSPGLSSLEPPVYLQNQTESQTGEVSAVLEYMWFTQAVPAPWHSGCL